MPNDVDTTNIFLDSQTTMSVYSVTITTEVGTNDATTLSRMNFSGYV